MPKQLQAALLDVIVIHDYSFFLHDSLFLVPWFARRIQKARNWDLGEWVNEMRMDSKEEGEWELFNEKTGWGMNFFGKEFGMMMGTSLAKINYLITEKDLGLPTPDPFYNY